MNILRLALSAVLAASFVGCSGEPEPAGASKTDTLVKPATNRIEIPPAVRQNLGITFAKVDRRPVRQTLRFPGLFELRPEARREFRVMAPGRVKLQVTQFQAIEPGTLLLTLDSPQWRELQHEAVEAEGEIKVAQAALDVARAQKVETEQAAAFLRQRIDGLRQAELRNVELEAQLSDLENRLPRLEAEIESKRVGLDEAQEHYHSRLNTLASLAGVSIEALLEPVGQSLGEGEHTSHPRWRTLSQLELRAEIAGVVDTIDVTEGAWMEIGGLALTVVDPKVLRFRAQALQSDMGRLSTGQAALIVPPQGGTIELQDELAATLSVGFRGSPGDRTIPLYAVPHTLSEWVKPGVSAFLEVFVGGSEEPELAIPASAVVRDGLVPIIFRRDPKDPDKAVRLEADLGPGNGRWVVVNSGVTEGDEVVLDGAYQLMLASSDTSAKGGHFHADGTFHAGEDEE